MQAAHILNVSAHAEKYVYTLLLQYKSPYG